jgi:hypothetical protein
MLPDFLTERRTKIPVEAGEAQEVVSVSIAVAHEPTHGSRRKP